MTDTSSNENIIKKSMSCDMTPSKCKGRTLNKPELMHIAMKCGLGRADIVSKTREQICDNLIRHIQRMKDDGKDIPNVDVEVKQKTVRAKKSFNAPTSVDINKDIADNIVEGVFRKQFEQEDSQSSDYYVAPSGLSYTKEKLEKLRASELKTLLREAGYTIKTPTKKSTVIETLHYLSHGKPCGVDSDPCPQDTLCDVTNNVKFCIPKELGEVRQKDHGFIVHDHGDRKFIGGRKAIRDLKLKLLETAQNMHQSYTDGPDVVVDENVRNDLANCSKRAEMLERLLREKEASLKNLAETTDTAKGIMRKKYEELEEVKVGIQKSLDEKQKELDSCNKNMASLEKVEERLVEKDREIEVMRQGLETVKSQVDTRDINTRNLIDKKNDEIAQLQKNNVMIKEKYDEKLKELSDTRANLEDTNKQLKSLSSEASEQQKVCANNEKIINDKIEKLKVADASLKEAKEDIARLNKVISQMESDNTQTDFLLGLAENTNRGDTPDTSDDKSQKAQTETYIKQLEDMLGTSDDITPSPQDYGQDENMQDLFRDGGESEIDKFLEENENTQPNEASSRNEYSLNTDNYKGFTQAQINQANKLLGNARD